MLPPIRYPLPTLIVLVLLGLAAWRGERMTRSVRASLAARWARAVEGPPVPSSNRPKVVAGPIVRKALLLHDEVAASPTPGGTASETIRLRMFVDIYDVWPLSGEPAFYRVGNRRPIGWVQSADLLPWDTRLVVRARAADTPGDAGPVSHPALSWTADSVELALWAEGQPWQALRGRSRVALDRLGAADWGVWLSREELLGLLRRIESDAAEPPGALRLRAILGRVADPSPLSPADLAAARRALPASAFAIRAASPQKSAEDLARLNERWSAEASWGGFAFRFVPLEALP